MSMDEMMDEADYQLEHPPTWISDCVLSPLVRVESLSAADVMKRKFTSVYQFDYAMSVMLQSTALSPFNVFTSPWLLFNKQEMDEGHSENDLAGGDSEIVSEAENARSRKRNKKPAQVIDISDDDEIRKEQLSETSLKSEDADRISGEDDLSGDMNSGSFSCNICEKVFSKKYRLNNHKVIHSSNRKRTHQCEKCPKKFYTRENLHRHTQEVHAETRSFPCSICLKTFKSKSCLTMHKRVHNTGKEIPCPVCNRLFRTKQHMEAHKVTHQPDRERPYKCPKCDSAFLRRGDLQLHDRVHWEDKPHSCTICAKKFKTLHEVDIHQVVHSDNKDFSCSTCGKSFRRKVELSQHEQIHLGDARRTHPCQKCDKSFSNKQNLSRHLKTVHSDIRLHSCVKCAKPFKTKGEMQTHMKIHGPKDIACGTCGTCFSTKMALKAHESMKHPAQPRERTHRCHECESLFFTRYELTTHIARIHTNARPHECTECSKKFKTKGELNNHIKHVHTATRNFCCDKCGKTFSWRNSWKTHLLTHTDRQRDHECTKCGATFFTKGDVGIHVRRVHGDS